MIQSDYSWKIENLGTGFYRTLEFLLVFTLLSLIKYEVFVYL